MINSGSYYSSMKSITIHNLDERLAVLIEKISKKEGVSQNNTIKKLLLKALGISERSETEQKSEYKDLFGIWTATDYQEFQKHMDEFSKVDPKDWK